MSINFPLDPAIQIPINEYSPISTPETNTFNEVSYYWDGFTWTSIPPEPEPGPQGVPGIPGPPGPPGEFPDIVDGGNF